MQLLLLINDNYDKYTEKHKKNLSLPIWIKSVFMELVQPTFQPCSNSTALVDLFETKSGTKKTTKKTSCR